MPREGCVRLRLHSSLEAIILFSLLSWKHILQDRARLPQAELLRIQHHVPNHVQPSALGSLQPELSWMP